MAKEDMSDQASVSKHCGKPTIAAETLKATPHVKSQPIQKGMSLGIANQMLATAATAGRLHLNQKGLGDGESVKWYLCARIVKQGSSSRNRMAYIRRRRPCMLVTNWPNGGFPSSMLCSLYSFQALGLDFVSSL